MDGLRSTRGASLMEVLVSVQLVALIMVVAWPTYRLVAAAEGGGGWSGVQSRAWQYVQAEGEYLRSLSYARFRDPTTCSMDGATPFPAVRILPEEAEPGEPELPPPLRRAEVRITDEPVLGLVPDGCGPRRVSVVVYGPNSQQPVARGEFLRVPR